MARMVVYEKMHLSTDGDIYYDAMEVADVSEEGLRKALGEEREVPMQLMERVRHAWILQGEGKVDEAERAWKDIERKRHVVEDIPYFLSLKDRVLEEKKRVKGRLDELAKSVEKLSVHESAPLKVAYAFEPATNTHVLMSQAYVSAALEELVCLLREFDLVETWNKYAERSVLVEVLGLMHVVCRCELNLPWPVADREVLFSAQASDVLEDTGKYLISIRSERDEATRRSERLQIQLLDGCALAMQPTVSSNGTEVTRCEMELRVRDPRLRWAPAFLVNLVLKHRREDVGRENTETERGVGGMAARAAGEGGVRRLGEEEGAYCVGDSVWSVGSGYKLIRLVGSGSYGQVCLAKDVRDEALVAVKRIPNIFSSMLNAKRVLREVCILRRLSHHPNIIKLRDVFTKAGSGGKFTMVDGKLVSETLDVYLVTDYYSNGDLYSLRTMLDQQQAKIIFKQVLEGVQFLHSCGVWHRDLKSGNVLLGDGARRMRWTCGHPFQ
eukprot:jgi/Pico_ML_1/55563/g1232.t1